MKFPFKIAFQRSAADFLPIEEVKARGVLCARTRTIGDETALEHKLFCRRGPGLHKTYLLLATCYTQFTAYKLSHAHDCIKNLGKMNVDMTFLKILISFLLE